METAASLRGLASYEGFSEQDRQDIEGNNVLKLFPRVHVECDFHGAIRYDDELMIDAHVDFVGRSSWKVVFGVRGVAADETEQQALSLLAKGQMVMVAMDPKTQHARSLPDELREALLAS